MLNFCLAFWQVGTNLTSSHGRLAFNSVLARYIFTYFVCTIRNVYSEPYTYIDDCEVKEKGVLAWRAVGLLKLQDNVSCKVEVFCVMLVSAVKLWYFPVLSNPMFLFKTISYLFCWALKW